VTTDSASDTKPADAKSDATDAGKDSGADAGLCPPTTPTVGEPCAPEGLSCSYGSFTTCYCTALKWMCAV
jgi:hypothetical protein